MSLPFLFSGLLLVVTPLPEASRGRRGQEAAPPQLEATVVFRMGPCAWSRISHVHPRTYNTRPQYRLHVGTTWSGAANAHSLCSWWQRWQMNQWRSQRYRGLRQCQWWRGWLLW
eukprot:346493-Chlamydomonas_euryale.AAC.4